MEKDNQFEVSIKDCCQYNETDQIGFFNCPNCEKQQYFPYGEVGDIYECDCNAIITFE